MPKDIFDIAKGTAQGNKEAALRSFAVFGEALGNSIANMITLIDGIVVIGGGLAAAWELFAPAMFAEVNRKYADPTGNKYARVSVKVYNLEDETTFDEFSRGHVQSLSIPGSDRIVTYDNLARVGIGVSKLSASSAIAIGANAFAIQHLEPKV
jgi:glucokinase